MQVYIKRGFVFLLSLYLISCGSATKEEKGSLSDKKAELQKLRTEQTKLEENIRKLEDEIAKLDSGASVKPKLVEVAAVTPQAFDHYIDLQGRITTDNIYQVTPRGQGGQVKAIYVKEGDRVSKGQLIMKLEDAIIRQQIEQARVQLAYAKDIYARRKNLWDQNIGTEVELITAKNNVANIEKQIDLLNEQLSFSNVYADVSGVVETVTIRVGEIFTGSPMAGITIVNPSSLKVSVDIPENYLANVRSGAPVKIEIPDIRKSYNSSISRVSQLINSNSRGFTAEAKIPGSDRALKPNQMALVHIRDYNVNDAIVIPLTTIQTDDKGKFVFVMAQEKGRSVAKKEHVEVGQIYGDKIEVKQGLAAGAQIITQGFQSLYDGQPVTTSNQ